MSNIAPGQSDGLDPSVGQNRFTTEKLITYAIALIGIAILAFGLVNLNSWRQIDPKALAAARVAKETGLTNLEKNSLEQRQFEAASTVKSNFGRLGLIYTLAGAALLWLSRYWQKWRLLFSEQMLYGYAFLVPPIGWILYLFAYPTRGDPNRVIIRKNIGIMSLALAGGLIAYYLVGLLQTSALSLSDSGSGPMGVILGFFLTPQIAYFAGIFAGAYIAFRSKDVRAIAVAAQLVVLAIVFVVVSWLSGNAVTGMQSRGLDATQYGFLNLTSGFDIAGALIDYDRSSTYGQAFLVGALNTLLISVVGIALSTILGLIVGIARLSTNWLTSTVARIFVELMRNVPLLVLLFFLYAGVLLKLPQREDTLKILWGLILLNNRGVALPWFAGTETFSAWIPFLIVALIVGGVLWYFRNRTYNTVGRPAFSFWFVFGSFAAIAGLGILLVKPLAFQIPFIEGLNYARDENRKFVGLVMSPEFFGVLAGLVMYTGGYIGEVVRAGIQAVSKGQREAATALGLTQNQSLQLIVLPQALLVIIPPLTNQYLNLAKNSSLAIAIGYSDLYAVANTTFNQSGQSVQVILMMMTTYLLLSLSISVVMNFINKQVQIKER